MSDSHDAAQSADAAALASDLAYVRSLAEEGAHAPLLGGRYFIIWGGLMATASLAVYMNAVGAVAFGVAGFMAPWIIALVIGWALSFFMRARVSAKPGSATLGNRTAASVWFAAGVFMTSFFTALFVIHDNYTGAGVPPYFLFSLLYPLGFGLYGVAFMATSVAGRVAWLRYFGFASWGFALAFLFFLATPHQFLIGAAGLFVCALVPGVMLMRREPSEIV